MAYQIGEKAKAIHERLKIFMEQHIYPREKDYDEFTSNHENLWQYPDWYEDLKKEAKKQELWNLFLPKEYAPWSPGLTNVEIAVLFETMSRSAWAQQVFNCNAPDRGNMEVLAKYGTPEQQKEWLDPLLDGKIRSAYAMTEPDVASSDATNMELEIKRDGDEYVLNGRKWWTTNVINPHCKIMLVMGKSNPGNSRHTQHSTILVPTDTPGVEIVRSLRVFGENHSPGGEGDVVFKNVRVPVTNLILGEGRGFEIAQGRLGPGRFQYAMMFVGMAQRSLELMCDRAQNRVAFGEALSQKTSVQHEIARSRCDIEQCRLLVMAAAEKMDNHGIDAARDYISMLKIVAPKMCEDVSSRAMQIFGGMGVCQDTPLAHIFTTSRFCRIADGPDEVHMSQLAKLTMRSLSTKD
ncbi:acyl-CoA dehydrogenase family protein [Gammaproteobacteria bacterium]|jgi:acyl-CoA dehydrogenase|nr:acyl-CoA dehydrogenase family protein [Gammaproteobacteria bacterium]MDC0884465.1 acyl-CoA dehydrogenase family protein [Gammaproteobacteria bacterium]MDC1110044.1 acyl-CoA dehydrogenase family protein [Gammaproteobacteria bacterium]MDC1132223.1 acyl-CoA dehydrogenase family protein [Gammaproteobacteria bacterium]MDC3228577.1 acyl-CoA dehydrogenase family protein [Gammaproteobacteria bacterium]